MRDSIWISLWYDSYLFLRLSMQWFSFWLNYPKRIFCIFDLFCSLSLCRLFNLSSSTPAFYLYRCTSFCCVIGGEFWFGWLMMFGNIIFYTRSFEMNIKDNSRCLTVRRECQTVNFYLLKLTPPILSPKGPPHFCKLSSALCYLCFIFLVSLLSSSS
jgi:hypothetical protein